jgi:hypothetical protein
MPLLLLKLRRHLLTWSRGVRRSRRRQQLLRRLS